MATQVWQGGAGATAQVITFTLNNDFNDSETNIDIDLVSEGGTIQTVSITPSGVDETVIASALQAALAASSDSLFTAVTWTSSTNVVTGTAKTAGVPIYGSSTVTAGLGTITDAVNVASAATPNTGPNDWNTAANWSGAAVPGTGDNVHFSEGNYSCLYGLNATSGTVGTPLAVNELHVGPGFKGSIGQITGTDTGYYLQVDTNSGAKQTLVLNGRGTSYWIDGTCPSVYVQGGMRNDFSVRLKGDINNVWILGPDVAGKVDFADSMTLDNVYVLGATSATVNLGTSISSLDLIEMDSGLVTAETVPVVNGTINTSGGTLTMEGDLPITAGAVTLNVRSNGIVKLNSGGGEGTGDFNINIYGGRVDLSENDSDGITINQMTNYAGTYNEQGAAADITHSNNPDSYSAAITSVQSGTTIDWQGA